VHPVASSNIPLAFGLELGFSSGRKEFFVETFARWSVCFNSESPNNDCQSGPQDNRWASCRWCTLPKAESSRQVFSDRARKRRSPSQTSQSARLDIFVPPPLQS
jgi:hypothetical protein